MGEWSLRSTNAVSELDQGGLTGNDHQTDRPYWTLKKTKNSSLQGNSFKGLYNWRTSVPSSSLGVGEIKRTLSLIKIIKDKNQSSVQSLNFWQTKLKNDILLYSFSRPTPFFPNSIYASSVTSKHKALDFSLSHLSKTKFARAFTGFPAHSTAIPLHKQPSRSAHFSILIYFNSYPHYSCRFASSPEFKSDCGAQNVIRLPYHGLASTYSQLKSVWERKV